MTEDKTLPKHGIWILGQFGKKTEGARVRKLKLESLPSP